jgi:hypothetical protein
MAFDFPANPTNGQVFSPAGGPVYVFQDGVWLVNTIPPSIVTAPEAPNDGVQYGRQSLEWTPVAVQEAPNDGVQYSRQSLAWTPVPPIPPTCGSPGHEWSSRLSRRRPGWHT